MNDNQNSITVESLRNLHTKIGRNVARTHHLMDAGSAMMDNIDELDQTIFYLTTKIGKVEAEGEDASSLRVTVEVLEGERVAIQDQLNTDHLEFLELSKELRTLEDQVKTLMLRRLDGK